MNRPGGGIHGNLIGPNSAIFQGGGFGGGGFGGGGFGSGGIPVGPSGFHDPGMMSPEMMFNQPDGINDLHPDLPGGLDPLRIGNVRRPGAMPGMNGMFGPGGRINPGPGGFGGPGGSGGNMFM